MNDVPAIFVFPEAQKPDNSVTHARMSHDC